MEETLRKTLDNIFDRHREKEQARKVQQEAVVSAEAKFRSDFEAASNTIVEPAMNEIGEYIKAQGYEFRVERNKELLENARTGKTTPASIKLVIITKGESYSERNPSFSVFAETYSKKVRFHQSTPSMSGPAGEYLVADLTREMVQAAILKLMDRVFA